MSLMRVQICLVSVLTLLLVPTAAGHSLAPADINEAFEASVVSEINRARECPLEYAGFIERYLSFLRGRTLSFPNEKKIRTREGARSIKEAVRFLRQRQGHEALVREAGLDAASRSHLNDLLSNRTNGHIGSDGSTFADRARMFGSFTGQLAENINFRSPTPERVVASMLIDDGVPSRQHRVNLLNPVFRQVGVACGESRKNKRPICVVLLAQKFSPSKPS